MHAANFRSWLNWHNPLLWNVWKTILCNQHLLTWDLNNLKAWCEVTYNFKRCQCVLKNTHLLFWHRLLFFDSHCYDVWDIFKRWQMWSAGNPVKPKHSLKHHATFRENEAWHCSAKHFSFSLVWYIQDEFRLLNLKGCFWGFFIHCMWKK